MKTLKNWDYRGREGAVVTLTTDGERHLRLSVLEHDVIRVSLVAGSGWRLGRTWSIAPNEDVPMEGRNRDQTDGFTCPDFHVGQSDTGLTIETKLLRVTVGRPLMLTWEARCGDEWRIFATDRLAHIWQMRATIRMRIF